MIPTTIQNSFRHPGLSLLNSTSSEVEIQSEFDSDDDLPISEWTQQFNMARNFTENLQSDVRSRRLSASARLTHRQRYFRFNEKNWRIKNKEMKKMKRMSLSLKEALKAVKVLKQYFLYREILKKKAKNITILLV